VNDAIRHILSDPLCGEQKKGDLSGIRVYKFRVQDNQFLLAYELDKDTLFLLALGAHENFY
jgi:mRNA interferase RelE/StbE